MSESDIRENMESAVDFIGNQFSSQAMDTPQITVLIDDGWEIRWGDWTKNEKFSDLSKLAVDMKTEGIEPGIWIAPLLVDRKSSLIKDHPDWFVKNTEYKHPTGTYSILDSSHPEARRHLFNTIKSLVDAGFSKLKIDFLMVGSYEGNRFENITGMEAFALAMETIREAAGQDTYLLACGSPSLAVFPYVNAWRLGADIAFEVPTNWNGPTWTDVVDQARNISARWFLCDRIHCDADPALLREPHTPDSAITASWVASLTGGGLYFSDRFLKLEAKQMEVQLPAELLTTAGSGLSAKPNPLIPNVTPKELNSPSLWDRLSKKNNIIAPDSWILPSGKVLQMNWNTKKSTLLN